MTFHALRTAAVVVVMAGAARGEDANPYAAELLAAHQDAARLGPTAATVRYLSFAWTPKEARDDWRRLVDLWLNKLSREPELVRARRVSPTLVAIDVLAYGKVFAAAWEALADEDPYFHARVELFGAVGWPGGRWPGGKVYGRGAFQVQYHHRQQATTFAPWLPVKEAGELFVLTQSVAPIVRADWWFSRAAIQFGRKGTGYYDFLGVKERKDFDGLIEFDRKKSQGIKREVAAIVARSGVSNFPRQVFREQSLTGGRWETRDDITDNKDARNPLRQLNGDFKHEAEEIFGVLPNGLFTYFLGDVNGVRQDSAPDGIGFDKTAKGNDGKIHVGLACVRCHVEGLRPIQDWGRRVYSGPLALTSPDPDKHRRLTQLYLGELQEWYDDDNARYARTLKRLTGWKPSELSAFIGDAWHWYVERDLLPADLAAELGVTEEAYLKKLRDYYRVGGPAGGLGDPVLASHLADPPLPIRSDDIEQLYPLVAPVILGGSK